MKDHYGNELAALAKLERESAKEVKRENIAFNLAVRRGEQVAMFVMLANWIIDKENLTVDEIKARVKETLTKAMGVKG